MRTLNEAADALNTTRHRLRRGIDAGRYPSMAWGKRLLVDLDVIGPIVAAEDAANEKTMGISEMSQQTGLPVGTLRKMCKDGLVPCERDKQGRYRFRPAEVMQALQNMME